MRKLLMLASIGVLVAAFALVPLPVVTVEPGPALDVPGRLRIGAETDPVEGSLLLTTVSLSAASAAEVVAAWLADDERVVREDDVIPPGVDPEEYFRSQRQVFAESTRVAAAVALRAEGHEVQVRGGGVEIAGVIDGSPAEGELKVGDLVASVDGMPVRLAADLIAALSTADEGDAVRLEVRRGSETLDVRVELAEVDELGRPGLGVALRTRDPDIDLPFDVRLAGQDIAGPSAGLVLALAIYDLVSDDDVVRGRRIAGTGTIDVAGRVGPVGGIAEKVAGAVAADAELFLAPAEQAAEARAAAGDDLRVVSAATFAQALRALR